MKRRTVVLLILLQFGARGGHGAIHEAILTRHGGVDFAMVDVSSPDVDSVAILVSGRPSIELEIEPPSGATSSPDLLPLVLDSLALLRVYGLDLPVRSTVVLRQRGRALFVPPYQSSRGTQFRFPAARARNGSATLYIGNPSAGDSHVTYRVGSLPSESMVVASGTVAGISLPHDILLAAALVVSDVPVILMMKIEAEGKIVPLVILPGG